ncbi:MAG TPA: ABC transporter permease [Vicinamibacterales bacterium]|jgi:putative ABC transport system permease protein|nr:ABC transporter permease [Vicinamibacterales bacterium]
MSADLSAPRAPKSGSLRSGLLAEILLIALDTLRANKLRSALTILGVVIGVTSIVAMTALIRGFGDQMQQLIRQMGAETVYVAKLSIASFAAGRDFFEVMKRPDITEEDAKAIRIGAPSVATVGVQLGNGPGSQPERVVYRDQSTKRMAVIGTSANFAETNYIELENGRFFTDYEVQHRRNVVVLGYAPASTLFPTTDPIGKRVRIGSNEYTVVGTMGKRPSIMIGNADEFMVIPVTTYDKVYEPPRIRGILARFLVIAVVPRPGVSREQLLREVEQVMRSRHRLKLDEENDFDTLTSDTIQKIVNQVTQAIVLALVVISSIALMVGGIGVMAIMTISVTERTREIGVRKAIGARRREILTQFLLEAVFLTALGGILGILFGSGIAFAINTLAGFPVSLPWWSYMIGLGFSAGVGIFFGMWPAIKASRLDPIEALRYE